jgi:hypothetical protein
MKILAAYKYCGEEKAHDYSLRLWQAVFSLLMAARPSIQRSTFQWDRDRDNIYFLGFEVDALMFLTSENQKFEFRTSTILRPSRPLQNN